MVGVAQPLRQKAVACSTNTTQVNVRLCNPKCKHSDVNAGIWPSDFEPPDYALLRTERDPPE